MPPQPLPYAGLSPHELRIGFHRPTPDGALTVTFVDEAGNEGSASRTLDLDTAVAGTTWRALVEELREGTYQPSLDALAAFGDALWTWLIGAELARPWQGARQAATGKALRFVLEFGADSDDIAALPWELVRERGGHLLREPGASLVRAWRNVPAAEARLPASPRVLFAWSCPPGTQAFDPEPHRAVLRARFGDGVRELPNAALEDLRAALEAERFDIVHVLAHGWRDDHVAGVMLENGAVTAEDFGRAFAGRGVTLVLLCACQSAVGVGFTGVGQRLLLPAGGAVPMVVATQGNLAVRQSERFAARFYDLLREFRDPAAALAQARVDAWGQEHYWCVPVLLARPRAGLAAAPRAASELPPRPDAWVDRDGPVAEVVAALRAARLVSVTGLPGTGKTEATNEAARSEAARFRRVLFLQALPGMTEAVLVATLAARLGLEPGAGLAAIQGALAGMGPVLLVIDNAEDLLRTEADQDAFAATADALLGAAPELRILLSTRWAVERTRTVERLVTIPGLQPAEAGALLDKELELRGAPPAEGEPRARLLALVDGHPRTLSLLAAVVATRGLARALELVERYRAEAVVPDSLVGRPDAVARLGGKEKARLKSLVATMDLSYDTVLDRDPDAARAFLGLSCFPAGLAWPVALAIDEHEGLAIERAVAFGLAHRSGERVHLPIPLGWCAERRRKAEGFEEEAWLLRAVEAYAGFALRSEALLTSGSILVALDQLLPEAPTLIHLAVRLKPGSKAMADVAAASHQVLQHADLLAVDRVLLPRGLADAVQVADRVREARCLLCLGYLKIRDADLVGARKDVEAALAICQQTLNRQGEASCLSRLGEICFLADDPRGAHAKYASAIPIYRQVQDRRGEANCLRRVGDLLKHESKFDEAGRQYELAVALFQELHDRLGEANCLAGLGGLRLAHEELDAARKYYQRALLIFREIRERLGEANTMEALAMVLATEQRERSAFQALLEVLAMRRTISDPLGEQATLGYLARVAAAASPDRALILAERALQQGRAIRDRFGQSLSLELQVQVFLACDDSGGGICAAMSLLPLLEDLGDERAAGWRAQLAEWQPLVPPDIWSALQADPEAWRLAAIERAKARLGDIDPLSPLPEDTP